MKVALMCFTEVTIPNIEKSKVDIKAYQISINGGANQSIENYKGIVVDNNISANGGKKWSNRNTISSLSNKVKSA